MLATNPLDDDEIEDRLRALQRRLERHGDVGSVLSIALLMGVCKLIAPRWTTALCA